MIEIIGLTAGYEKDNSVIKGLSFSVDSSEIVSIRGRNGAGKSTLARAIMGQMPYCEGEIKVDGKDITKMNLRDRQISGIGWLMQTHSTFCNLSISENIKLAYTRSVVINPRASNHLVELAIEKIFPTKTRNRKANQLSGGERRMLSLLMLVGSNPNLSVLILDELNSGVDNQNKKKISELLAQLQNELGFTILSIEHDQVKLNLLESKIINI